MDDVARLVALEAIRQLKARYFRFLDTKNWDGLENVFTPDAVIDFRESMGQKAEDAEPHLLTHGAATLVANLRVVMADVVTVHQGFMPEITFVDDNTATGIWSMAERLRAEPGSAMPFRTMDAWGHYHETYVHRSDGWRIAALRLTRLRVDMD